MSVGTLVSGCRDGVGPGVGECEGDGCAPSSVLLLEIIHPNARPVVMRHSIRTVGMGKMGHEAPSFCRCFPLDGWRMQIGAQIY